MPRRLPRITLHQGRTRPLPIPGASAVATAPGVMFLAEDDDGIYKLQPGRCALWAGPRVHPALGDLEGLAMDERRGLIWALAEESGEVVELPIASRRRVARVLGRLPRPGRKANKGFEGLAYLPARVSPNRRASLVAAHEGKPRRVAVFALPDLEETHHFKLPRDAKRALDDLADVTIDPVTGAVLLLSEESRRIGVFRIDDGALVLDDLVDVQVERKARPEGLDFVTRSRLVVVTEGPATVIDFRVTRVR
jgi:SdiA-regulated